MKTTLLKTEALCWLRYTRKMDTVCTEGGYWSADVIGATEKSVIEVEVKTSRADLLAEFRNKKAKHTYYLNHTNWSPNYFYFLVPLDLAPEAIEIVKEKFPKAGVLAYAYPRLRAGERLKVMKPARALHDKKPFGNFLESIRRRSSSELCSMHIAMDNLDQIEISQIEELKTRIVGAIVDSLGVGEWEKFDGRVDSGAVGSGEASLGSGTSDPSDDSVPAVPPTTLS